MGYYGMFRIGELVVGCNGNDCHTIKATNVHVAKNKNKIMIMLYSSKTQGTGMAPQKIKITGKDNLKDRSKAFFCPFTTIKQFLIARGNYSSESEPFFVFRSGIKVTHQHVRSTLSNLIKNVGLDPKVYGTHRLHAGRACDMLKFGYTVDEIKRAGRWKSNAVFRYLKNI